MSQTMIVDIMRDALLTILLTAGPVLGVALVVGLIISIIQATTQVQEQTLTFVPKIVAVFATIILFGPYMLNQVTSFTIRMFDNISNMIR
ncbi:MAG: flagellar biosynthesis protein FliQ [Clostridiales bacterium]|nr:flagellar biosynthesis protein FliQ [Clostridiales bacterium]